MLLALFEQLFNARQLRRVLGVLAIAVFFSSSAYAQGADAEPEGSKQVETVYSGIPHDAIYDMQIVGDYGVAVGNYGLILESSDSGASWAKRESATRAALLGVAVAGEHRIIVGQQGTVLVSGEDGSWQLVEGVPDLRLLNVAMNGDGLTVAVGQFGTILRSNDRGRTWEALTLDWMEYSEEGYEPHLYDVIVTNTGEVAVTGEFGLILWSVDGGANWEVRHKSDESIFALHISTASGLDTSGDLGNVGFAVGQDGVVLRTVDQGKTWKRVEVPTTANLLGVWADNSEVVITGIRALLRSSDDGETWTVSKDLSVIRNWYQAVAPGVVEVATAGKGFLRQQVIYLGGYEAHISRVLR